MEKVQTHYYIMGKTRFENMKGIQEFIGSDSRVVFRNLRKSGFIKRIEITSLDGEKNNTVNGKENRV